jgi:hypothetical protein
MKYRITNIENRNYVLAKQTGGIETQIRVLEKSSVFIRTLI